jgi:hypothetical protein
MARMEPPFEEVRSQTTRHDESSSDSSLLEVPLHFPRIKRGRSLSPVASNHDLEEYEQQKQHRHRAQSLYVSKGSSGRSRPHPETFERRPRRKTREDRYEPKKINKAQGDSEVERPRAKKIKKSRRKKDMKKGDDIMQDFSSEKIAQERLTVRSK